MSTSKHLIRRLWVVLSLAGLMITAVTLQWWSFQTRTLARVRSLDRLIDELPHLRRDDEYVSSDRCQSCHPAQHASWHRTYHRTMTQVALPRNVAGAFNGRTVWSEGLAYRVFREGDGFWAEMPDPDYMMHVVQGGKQYPFEKIPRVHRRVTMTTGSHHYQTYWVSSERYDRLMQTLPLVFLVKDKRWIPREEAFMRSPGEARMITQWNHHCIRCHSTGGIPGLNAESGMLESRVGELGIACEACHGPGEEHVRSNQDPRRRYELHVLGEPDSSIVNPAKLEHRASSQVCGQCHGVYIMRDEYAMRYAYEGSLYRPGDDLHKTRYYIQHPHNDPTAARQDELQRNPSFFAERWWDDGTVLAGGREFTAMLVSGCYTRGEISCLSCHSMHESDPVDQLKPGMRGELACTQCHDDPQYTRYVSSHSFHEPDSSGSNCLNCHMPHTTYALLGAIRNHQIGSPQVASSARHGVPNACNLCHLDKTLAWTQEHIASWYGQQGVPLTPEQQNVSAALLWLLKGHAAQRVIAAWHVGWEPAQQASGDDWQAPFQARLLNDPYGVVRYVAAYSLRTLPGFEHFDFDFLTAEEDRKHHVLEVVARWRKNQSASRGTNREPTLIDADGNVMEARVQQLLEQRDNRPVTIKE